MAEEIIQIPEPSYENGIWKGGKVKMPDGYYKIEERILNQFKKYPDFVGQIDGITGRKDTYADMGDRSVRCALWLKKQGISPGDVVGICSKNHLDSCIPVYASFYIGAIFNPWWDTCLDEELVKNLIETTQPKVLFINENYAEIITKTITKMNYSLLIIVFERKNGYLSFEDVLKTQTKEDVEKFECTRVKPKDPVTRLWLGTPILNRLTKVKDIEKYDLSSVKLISYGGAAANGQIIKKLPSFFKNADISAHYGSTECGTVIVGSTRFDKFDSCGKVFFNVDIKVIDPDTNKILGPNEKGELCISSPKLMIGYWKNPAKTEKIVDSDGWYHSGDLGYYDEAGVFFIEIRIKDSIKCYLFNVIPRTVENVIQGCPGVAEVAVVAKPSFEEHCEVLMAFVTKIPGVQITDKEIIEFVEKNLANEVKLLGGVYFLDQMPYTPSKKIAKNRLYAMAKTIC